MIDGERQSADWAIPAVVLATVAWGRGPLMVRAMDGSGDTTALFRMWLGAPAMVVAARLFGRPVRVADVRTCVLHGCFFGGSMMLGFPEWIVYLLMVPPLAVTALSLPSLIMLKRVVKMPLLVTFTGVVTLGILSIGLIFNAMSNWFI